MPYTLNAAARLAIGLKEIVRLTYRDGIQHGGNSRAIQFMQRPIMELTRELHTLLTVKFPSASDPLVQVLAKIGVDHQLDALNSPIYEYKGLNAERLLKKELERRSTLPTRMLTIIGSHKIPDSRTAEAAYELGKKLAQSGVIVICSETSGIMTPLLTGLIDHNGLTIGIVPKEDVSIKKDRVLERSGLIKLPITVPDQDDTLRTPIATMSGRALLVLGGDNSDPANFVGAAMQAAYVGLPTLLVNVKLPAVAKHPLQTEVELDQIYEAVARHLPLDSNIILDRNYHYFKNSLQTPVSVLAGTKFDGYNVSGEYCETVGRLLAANNFFTITGSGPGPMEWVARGAQLWNLTLGINFFPTYLAANHFIDVPIVGNVKMERSDFMHRSAVAVVNLGGSHTTVYELIRALKMGIPVINAAPNFPTEYFNQMGSGSDMRLVNNAESPEAILAMLQMLRQNRG